MWGRTTPWQPCRAYLVLPRHTSTHILRRKYALRDQLCALPVCKYSTAGAAAENLHPTTSYIFVKRSHSFDAHPLVNYPLPDGHGVHERYMSRAKTVGTTGEHRMLRATAVNDFQEKASVPSGGLNGGGR